MYSVIEKILLMKHNLADTFSCSNDLVLVDINFNFYAGILHAVLSFWLNNDNWRNARCNTKWKNS